MRPLLERNLVVVTGKGGVGKTTLAATIGVLAARRGARTIVVELGDQARLPQLFGADVAAPGSETPLAENLYGTTIDPDRVLLEWVQELGGRLPGRVLASSGTFQYFAAAAPGAKELFAMVKVWELTQTRRWRRRAPGYDLVVLDAPATGHALGMLRSTHTFGAIARVGPVAAQAERVQALLGDDSRSAYLAVAQATEMAVSETLELQGGLRSALGRELEAVIVNGLLPRRFSAAEMRRIAALDGHASVRAKRRAEAARSASDEQIRHDAAHAARAVHERARFQHNQVARLRRRDFEVLGVPFLWGASVDVGAVHALADQLARRL
ncbi:MAG TPA: ArsA-related P-loop ATPase [Solirubrobacteraceae bacterium]|nr:ArsA-related P-loop ATPase [Solirubrobacteraceae bacterium]